MKFGLDKTQKKSEICCEKQQQQQEIEKGCLLRITN